MRSSIFRIVPILLSLTIPPQVLSQLPQYNLIRIDSVSWWQHLGVEAAINNHSEIVSQSVAWKPFHWKNGVTTILPTLGGDAVATNINDNSVIVGGSAFEPRSEVGAPVRWIGGNISPLTTDPKFEHGMARGINTSGTIVGWVEDTTGKEFAFIFDGTLRTVDLGGTFTSGFLRINDEGCALTSTGFYLNGQYTDLGTAVRDINNRGQIVGSGQNGGFLWKDGIEVLIGGVPNAINDNETIVGYASPGHDVSHPRAVVWIHRVLYDLDDLLPPGTGVHIINAFDVNNRGEIVCVGQPFDTNAYFRYLLVPDNALDIRDAKNEIIPNVEFNLIRVTNNPPFFTENTLGSFTTNSEGRLELTPIDEHTFSVDLNTGTKQLVVGDSLKIAKHVHSVPAAKHEGVLGTMYSVHLDNAHFAEDGHMYFDTLKSRGLEVVLNHTELRYNLLVSVEWDAALSYLSSLEAGLKAVSNYLYDVSDGQIRLDTVLIVDNKANWDDADIKIYASNMVHPHVDLLNGIVRSGASGAPVEMPRKWFGNPDACRNGTYTENPLNLEDDNDLRTKCHELGHYALNFGDEYRFADGSGGLVDGIGRCGAIANYGFMDHQYEGWEPLASEMSSIYQYADGACQNTEQFVLHFGSCWDQMEEQYEWEWGSASIFVPIITPDDAERELPDGFDYLPGPNGEMFELDYDVGALVQFPVEQYPPDLDIVTLEVQVETPTHRVSKADVNLINHFNTSPKKIYQGQTDDGHGRIWVVGASESDHLIQATSGLAVELTGNLPHAAASTGKVWMCGEESVGGTKEKGVSNLVWSAGDSVVIQLREVQGNYPLICGVSLGDDTATYRLDLLNPFSAPPRADLLPDAGGVHSYDFTTDGSGYGASMTDSLGGSGTITVWAKDDLSQDFFFSTDYTVGEFDTSAAMWNLMGAQGGAEVWIDTSNATLQKGMILSSPYLIIRTGLTDANIQAGEAHSLSVYPPAGLTGHNQVVIRYADSDLDAGTGIVGRETSLQVFYWNGDSHQWEPIGGSVDTIQNTVSAVISDVGEYAAFTTEVVTGIEDDERGDILPYKFELSQNYPNPFNPVTTIEYAIPSRCEVTIEVFNVLGQKVRTLVNEAKSTGSYRIEWNGADEAGRSVSTGVYLYRFQAGDVVQTKKMLLLK